MLKVARSPKEAPTDERVKPKPDHRYFGGKKNGRKIRSKFFRSIFNPTHHFVLLCFYFLAVRMAFVRKRCGRKFGRSVLVDSLPKLYLPSFSYS